MSSAVNAVVAQPFGGGAWNSGGAVEIKPATRADCDFVAGVLVDAFESKFEHAAGKQK